MIRYLLRKLKCALGYHEPKVYWDYWSELSWRCAHCPKTLLTFDMPEREP